MRARAVFVQQASSELSIADGGLKTDLGRLLLKLEALQDEAIREALAPNLGRQPGREYSPACERLAGKIKPMIPSTESTP